MEQLKSMKQCLMAQAQGQMGNLHEVDAKELGEVIDMIKDLEEAIYYCTIVEAMEKKDKEEIEPKYYTQPRMRKYYSEISSTPDYYTERPMEWSMRDSREGKSPIQRRMYMESKEMHQGKETQMKELEKYMQELTNDITEMIEGATPEEKQVLKSKISTLAAKL